MLNNTRKLSAIIGASFAASMAVSQTASADQSLFGFNALSHGYNLAMLEGSCGADKNKEGSCGEKKKDGSCGEKKADGKCGEKKADGSCGEKKADGKCGEGKCGEKKAADKK